jgi:hypothetical protein
MDRILRPWTRRSFLQGGVLASLSLVASLGSLPIPDVAAGKNDGRKAKSIAKRVKNAQELCQIGGGTSTVSKKPGGTTVACKGGGPGGGDFACTITSKGQRCHATRMQPDGPDQPLQPDSPVADPEDTPDFPLEPDGGGGPLT